jgi:hypothetical protein
MSKFIFSTFAICLEFQHLRSQEFEPRDKIILDAKSFYVILLDVALVTV